MIVPNPLTGAVPAVRFRAPVVDTVCVPKLPMRYTDVLSAAGPVSVIPPFCPATPAVMFWVLPLVVEEVDEVALPTLSTFAEVAP